MVREVKISGLEGKPGRALTVNNWADAYDPSQLTPAEICEIREDRLCPRCSDSLVLDTGFLNCSRCGFAIEAE